MNLVGTHCNDRYLSNHYTNCAFAIVINNFVTGAEPVEGWFSSKWRCLTCLHQYPYPLTGFKVNQASEASCINNAYIRKIYIDMKKRLIANDHRALSLTISI